MNLLNSQFQSLTQLWQGKILRNCSMAQYSTLKVGGPAEVIVFAESISELGDLIRWLSDNNIIWQVIGRGSNILVTDKGLPGVTVILGRNLSCIKEVGLQKKSVFLKVGGGCHLARLVAYCTKNELTGLEFGVGIPGSVGGAITMNAGCWKHSMSDIIKSVTIMTANGEIRAMSRKECNFTYRTWGGPEKSIILDGTFSLERDDANAIKTRCQEYQLRRKQNQPYKEKSAGSFFKNPPDAAAGKLIEQAGMKGHQIGGAMVSTRHANFIINTGNATPDDILALMREVQQKVFETSGYMLEPEVHIFGEGHTFS